MFKTKKIWLAFLLVFALVASGFQTSALAAGKQGTITVQGTDQNNSLAETSVQFGDNETALEALTNLVGKDNVVLTHYSFGDMITGIKGLSGDDNHFWGFYVNDASVNEGAGTYKVQDGDKLSFRYEAVNPVSDGTDSTTTNEDTNAASNPLPKGTLQTAIDKAANFYNDKPIGEWEAIALKQASKPIPAGYLENVKQVVKDKQGTFRSITDTERYSLGILAAGGDPTNIEGYNLINAIYNGDVTKQGLNGVAYGLIALNSANFKVPDTASWTKEKLVTQLLEKQNQDGGWHWDPTSTTSDVDTTAMVLTALAPYKDQAGVKEKVNAAVQYVVDQFNQSKIDNSSTASQVIIALSALGIDANGSQLTKDNTSLVQYLLTFQNADGGFDWQGGDTSDEFSTSQGILALVAYQLYSNGKGSLYTLPLMPQVQTPAQNQNPTPVKVEQPAVQTPQAVSTAEGHPLPDTATDSFNMLLIGLLFILIGSVFFFNQRRKA